MTEAEARAELARLESEIARLDEAYHRDDAPLATDADYDALRRKVGDIERAYPALARADAASRRVGAAPAGGFGKRRHGTPMVSLANAFDALAFAEFWTRARRFLGRTEKLTLVGEPKIDGLSISLTYEHGELVAATTRGDGQEGEDVTANIRTMAVPTKLSGPAPARIEIRGEVFMTKADFLDLNAAQEAAGLRLFANPRNAAAGSLRQLDARVTAGRALSLFAYAQGAVSERVADTHTAFLARLATWGFRVNDRNRRLEEDEAAAFQAETASDRASLPYDIDGVVYKVDDLGLQARLGFVGREPRWATAWKFPAEQAATVLEAILIQVGRTGALTPVAALTPVNVGGVLVTRATLHNEDEIARKDVRVGDTVLLQRAGDVIPQILGPVPERRPPGATPFIPLESCPVCGSPAVRPPGEVVRRCTGSLACAAQIEEQLVHAAGRSAFDIEGLGERTVREFHRDGLLATPADIFRLPAHEATIAAREGWGVTSAANLMRAVEQRRRIALDRFIVALGIRRIGTTNARLLAHHAGSYVNWRAQMEGAVVVGSEARSDLAAIIGVGPAIAAELAEFFAAPRNAAAVDDLAAQLDILPAEAPSTAGALAGQVVVFTGTLATMTRQEARAHAEALGAKVTDSVTRKTDLVVAGADAGSKAKRAAELGIRTVDEADWRLLSSYG